MQNRIITKKPVDDKKLKFPKMGAKPVKKQTKDVENAADAAKPGDAAEDTKKASQQKGSSKGSKKKTNSFAKKAASLLSGITKSGK